MVNVPLPTYEGTLKMVQGFFAVYFENTDFLKNFLFLSCFCSEDVYHALICFPQRNTMQVEKAVKFFTKFLKKSIFI